VPSKDSPIVNTLKRYIFYSLASIVNLQSKNLSKRVIEQHYNFGNDFFFTFLDKKHQMYSSGYFKNTNNLEAAEDAKLEIICKKLNLKEGDKVLDIGSGWGGFARYACKNYGCKLTCVNPSKEQNKYILEHSKGLSIEVLECDYRDLEK